MADFELKKGSTKRAIRLVVSSTNSADDLSDVESGELYMWLPGTDTNKIDGEALSSTEPVVGSQHKVTCLYYPEADDVDEAGEYSAYVKLNFPDGKSDRFPASGVFTILIEETRE